jgi:hypothetical protein
MHALHEQRHFNEVSKRQYMKFCQTVTLEQVLKQNDLFKYYSNDEPEEKLSEARLQDAIKQMKTLEVSMGSEIKPIQEVKVQIVKRVVQVHGDLFEYNPLEDENILRVKNVFLCVDQTGQFTYMLNVLDQT